MELLEAILEVKFANEVVEFAGQFFNCVEGRGEPIEETEDGEHGVFTYHPGVGNLPVDMEAGDTPIDDSQ